MWYSILFVRIEYEFKNQATYNAEEIENFFKLKEKRQFQDI